MRTACTLLALTALFLAGPAAIAPLALAAGPTLLALFAAACFALAVVAPGGSR